MPLYYCVIVIAPNVEKEKTVDVSWNLSAGKILTIKLFYKKTTIYSNNT